MDFWDLTNRQDWAACESVQRGLTSPHAVPGPLAPEEDGVYQFVSRVARAYAGSASDDAASLVTSRDDPLGPRRTSSTRCGSMTEASIASLLGKVGLPAPVSELASSAGTSSSSAAVTTG